MYLIECANAYLAAVQLQQKEMDYQTAFAVMMVKKQLQSHVEFLQNEELKTISTALYKFTGPYGNQYNYICAGVLITIIPIFVLFLIFQKQIYSGMAAGAVKG